MTDTLTKGSIYKNDLALWDGASLTGSRKTSTGGTQTLDKFEWIGVDVYAIEGERTLSAISNIISIIGSTNERSIWLSPGEWTITDDLTITSNISLLIPNGATLNVSAGKTLTINGEIRFPMRQVFTGTGSVVFDNVFMVFADWFGSARDKTCISNMLSILGSTNPYEITFSNDSTWNIDDDLDLSDNTNLHYFIPNGCIFSVAAAKTLTFDSPDQLTAPKRKQIFTGSGTIAFDNKNVVYPEWWGAVGDWNGATGTDDTSAISSAISTNCIVDFDGKAYRITSTLATISTSGNGIIGKGPHKTSIVMDADNDVMINIYGSRQRIEHITLKYANLQTAAHTNSNIIEVPSGNDFFKAIVRNVVMLYGYRGVKVTNSTFWMQQWEDVEIEGCYYNAIMMDSGSGGTGNHFSNLRITGNNQGYEDTPLRLQLVDTVFNQLNIEACVAKASIVYLDTSETLVFNSVHIEAVTPHNDNQAIFHIIGTKSHVIINGLNFQFCTVSTANSVTNFFVVRLYKDAEVIINGAYFRDNTFTGTNFKRIKQASDNDEPGASVYANLIGAASGNEPTGTDLDNAKTSTTDRPVLRRWNDEQYLINQQTATGTYSFTLYGMMSQAIIDSSGGAVTATLGSGSHIGQMIAIVMTDASNSSTVSVTNHETSDPEVFTFADVDDALLLMWTGTEWITVANSGVAT